MKTQYFARASIKAVSFVDEEGVAYHSYAVQNYVKINKDSDLFRLVVHTSAINTIGTPTIQLIPVTEEEYKANRSYLEFKTLKPICEYND